MSARETAIAALHATLASALAVRSPAPHILRNETVPQRIPAGGLVIVRDGEPLSETAMFSPLAWAIEHSAEVEIVVAGATPAARDAALDDLLAAIGAAIAADRTLGGAVEWAGPSAPRFEDIVVEGAAASRAALVTVTVAFTAPATPLA
jgi:hypothetical protein